jgi:hypothetical protein
MGKTTLQTLLANIGLIPRFGICCKQFYSTRDTSDLIKEDDGKSADDDGNNEKGNVPIKSELLQKKKLLPGIEPEASKIKQKETIFFQPYTSRNKTSAYQAETFALLQWLTQSVSAGN